MEIKENTELKGSLSFFTCKTGTGRTRYCVRVFGTTAEGKELTAQSFGDWDGMLPENLAAVSRETTFEDPETGLIRSVKGLLKGTVTVPAGAKVETVAGRTRSFDQVTLPDPAAFRAERTGLKLVRF